jgi:hypothetical protein
VQSAFSQYNDTLIPTFANDDNVCKAIKIFGLTESAGLYGFLGFIVSSFFQAFPFTELAFSLSLQTFHGTQREAVAPIYCTPTAIFHFLFLRYLNLSHVSIFAFVSRSSHIVLTMVLLK